MAKINNEAKKNVMTMAWTFVKKNGYNLSEALKCAWANLKFKIKAKEGIVKFAFQKVDGSLRQAFGTLKESLLPMTSGESRNNPTLQTYYDTEKDGWRCFKIANLVYVA